MKTIHRGFIVPVLLTIIAILLAGGVAYLYTQKKSENLPGAGNVVLPQATSTAVVSNPPVAGLETYTNTKYGFSFSLPASWKGYSIITNTWSGVTSGPNGDSVIATGPMVSIRHPLWTSQNPRQDIPIMIFSIQQWSDLQQGEFHIGAAPIGPSELGRNANYVFALPARYNYAYPIGYEEVDQIISTFKLTSATVSPTTIVGAVYNSVYIKDDGVNGEFLFTDNNNKIWTVYYRGATFSEYSASTGKAQGTSGLLKTTLRDWLKIQKQVGDSVDLAGAPGTITIIGTLSDDNVLIASSITINGQ